MKPKHVGVYQRPAPPKRPNSKWVQLPSGQWFKFKTPVGGYCPLAPIQKPAIPLHEIEAQVRDTLEDIQAFAEQDFAVDRKPGRPAIHGQAMTAAERQARRRALQSQDQAIREVLRTGDAHGKSRVEAKSGGYDTAKIDEIMGQQFAEENEDGDHVGRHVRAAEGASSASDEETSKELANSGEFDIRTDEVQCIYVRGIQIGDEQRNRRLFAEGELRKLVDEHFTSPTVARSPHWTARHNGNTSVERYSPPSITFTCKLCTDSMESIEDARDHLRADHRGIINAWFEKLQPRREFRDMGDFVTIVMPRKRRKPLGSNG
jgi:hypothetical protein